MRKRQQAGFTLIEIIVAIGIFALLSLGAYRVVNGVLGSRDRIEAHAEDTRRLMRLVRLLDADFEQIVNRPIVDETGEKRSYFDTGTEYSGIDGLIVEFSRQGHRNPLISRRSEIVRVAYGFQVELDKDDSVDGEVFDARDKNPENYGYIVRYVWPVLDRVEKTVPEKQIIFAGVESFDISYLNKEKEWEPTRESDEENQSDLPYAIKIHLTMKDGGLIERIYTLHPIKNEKQ